MFFYSSELLQAIKRGSKEHGRRARRWNVQRLNKLGKDKSLTFPIKRPLLGRQRHEWRSSGHWWRVAFSRARELQPHHTSLVPPPHTTFNDCDLGGIECFNQSDTLDVFGCRRITTTGSQRTFREGQYARLFELC